MRKITAQFSLMILLVPVNAIYAQDFNLILGRPEKNSITLSILFDQASEVYWEYGTVAGVYPQVTAPVTALKDTPLEANLTGLITDTKYYYRTRYRVAGSSSGFAAGPENTFQTCRAKGSSFSFAVEADPHLDTNTNPDAYRLTLQNILSAKPDFMFDLGDSFMSEKLAQKTQKEITARHLLYRPYFGLACHSVPLFLVLGNHEGEQGWKRDGTASCLPVMAANTRKLFYPNPIPDGFYSGNEKTEEFVGLLQNYYAMEWGDALFIVIDPYWYTTAKPGWGWTLGEDQYRWLLNTLSESNAKFRFVFCHQLVGGDGNDARGGAEFADFYEMGGKNADLTWGFDLNRQGWDRPIHQLMIDYHVNVFFHGHDHCYAKQDKDGIVYQEVPQPSSRNITNFTGSQYGYTEGTLLPSRGYMLVTMSDTAAIVKYIRTYLPSEETAGRKNGEIAHSYTLKSMISGTDNPGAGTTDPSLFQVSPNPIHDRALLRFETRIPGMVQIFIYDACGRITETLADEYLQPGTYTVSINRSLMKLSSGIYLCRIFSPGASRTIKLILN